MTRTGSVGEVGEQGASALHHACRGGWAPKPPTWPLARVQASHTCPTLNPKPLALASAPSPLCCSHSASLRRAEPLCFPRAQVSRVLRKHPCLTRAWVGQQRPRLGAAQPCSAGWGRDAGTDVKQRSPHLPPLPSPAVHLQTERGTGCPMGGNRVPTVGTCCRLAVWPWAAGTAPGDGAVFPPQLPDPFHSFFYF